MAVVSEKRLIRLTQFFQPYPYLNPQIGEGASAPVTFTTSPKRLFRLRRKPSQVVISPALLHADTPDWVEPTILHCALRMHQRAQGYHSEAVEEERPYRKLQSIVERVERSMQQRSARTPVGDPLRSAWMRLRLHYFATRPELDAYSVKWSSRKRTRCLATCNMSSKQVVVASAMNQPESLEYLDPLLYHEMCHAALGEPKVVNGRAVYHGREFRALERRHPGIKALDSWIRQGGWDRAVEADEERKLNGRRLPVVRAEHFVEARNEKPARGRLPVTKVPAEQMHLF